MHKKVKLRVLFCRIGTVLSHLQKHFQILTMMIKRVRCAKYKLKHKPPEFNEKVLIEDKGTNKQILKHH